METAKRHDWGLVVAGVLLVALALFFTVAPGLTLVTITAIAGAGFLVSGIFDAVMYVRSRRAMDLSGWVPAYAVLDIVLGLMFLLHPLALSGVIPWVIGAFLLVFGIFEVVAAVRVRRLGTSLWGWMLFSGIVEALCGLTFFLAPATFVVFLALFVVMRGVSLIVYGWNAGTGARLGRGAGSEVPRARPVRGQGAARMLAGKKARAALRSAKR